MSASGGSSELLIEIAIYTGLGAVAMVVLLVVVIFTMRIFIIMRDRRRNAFLATWRPVMAQAAIGPVTAPHMHALDRMTFLELFDNFHAIITGAEEKERFNQIAKSLGMEDFALKALQKNNIGGEFLSIFALGYLKCESALDPLLKEAKRKNILLSVSAVSAMININPKKVLPTVMPMIVERKDWPAAAVDRMLRSVGFGTITEPLCKMVMGARVSDAPRLLRFLNNASTEGRMTVVRHWLDKSRDPEVVSACLQMMRDPSEAVLARKYLSHEAWHIRMNAAAALGRTGSAGDVPLLLPLLTDREWWVRYRVAQAIAALPGMDRQKIVEIRNGQTDRYSKDALEHVLAEKWKS